MVGPANYETVLNLKITGFMGFFHLPEFQLLELFRIPDDALALSKNQNL
jgi:hypothetical protein